MKGCLYSVVFTLMMSPMTASAELLKPQTAKLDNGLEIVLVENHIAPVVSINVAYKVGTADDPVEMTGLSHFLEHLMFKGTKNTPIGDFKKKIISHGGAINAYTSHDVTAYTSDIPIDILDMVLELEADRMENLVFDEKETLAEQKVVIEERRMRLDNHPLGKSHETILRGLHKYHPYGIPPIGYPHHIDAYTNDAAKLHYQRWYAPNNAILFVSGDITMDKLLPMVKKYFSTIPAKTIPERKRPIEPANTETVSYFKVKSKRLSLTAHDWYYKAPNFKSEGKEHYYPLIVLAHILGGNGISRLYKDLVTDKQIAITISCDYSGDSIDPRFFVISAVLHPNAKLEDLKQTVERYLQDAAEKGITEKELMAAKRDLLASLAFTKDGNHSAISMLTDYAHGISIEEIESSPQKIQAVTVDQVNQAAKAILGVPAVVETTVSPDVSGHQAAQSTKASG